MTACAYRVSRVFDSCAPTETSQSALIDHSASFPGAASRRRIRQAAGSPRGANPALCVERAAKKAAGLKREAGLPRFSGGGRQRGSSQKTGNLSPRRYGKRSSTDAAERQCRDSCSRRNPELQRRSMRLSESAGPRLRRRRQDQRAGRSLLVQDYGGTESVEVE